MSEKTRPAPGTTHRELKKAILTEAAAREYEDELRGRLGLLPLGVRNEALDSARSWVLTGVLGLLAALLRFFRLGHPHELIFDETYYVKEAYSLLTHGFEGVWAEDVNEAFIAGDYSGLSTLEAEYVVHPPLGKWLMAIGQAFFGSDSGVGWRFTTAVLGVLAVMLVVRIALRMFRSLPLAGLAGFAMALDGMGIVMSRTGILDNILAFFILAGFWAVLRDRDASRARLAHAVATGPLTADGRPFDVWGPRLFFRPWLLVAGVLLGLSTGVKWSGLYAVAVFGILVFIWGVLARRAAGVPLFYGAGIFHEGVPAFVQLVPIVPVMYVACWASWFANPNSWGRTWAATAQANGEEVPWPWAPDALNSFVHYHQMMWEFHHGLDTPHDYQSKPWVWIVQARPVSFYWKGTSEMAELGLGDDHVQAITSIGNIAVWWLGVLALAALIVIGIRRADWRAGAIGAGYVATWLSWFSYAHRTIFQFYAITLLPFVVLALAYAVGALGRIVPAAHAPSREFAALFAGRSGIWVPGVYCDGTFDGEALMPDIPAEGAALGGGVLGNALAAPIPPTPRAASGAAPSPAPEALPAASLPTAPDAQNAGEDNVYARTLTRLLHAGAPNETTKPDHADAWWRAPSTSLGLMLLTATAALIALVAVLWYPIWTGSTVTYDWWHWHMFFSSWI